MCSRRRLTRRAARRSCALRRRDDPHQGPNDLHPEEVGEMDQSKANWIGAYLEWTNADGWAFGPGPLARGGFGEVSTVAGEEFAAAYLDWMDARQQLRESSPHDH